MAYLENQQDQAINISTSGDNTLIAAPGVGHNIVIDFISFFPTTAVTVTFKDSTRTISGPLPLDAKQTVTYENSSCSQYGVIKCADNAAFIMNLSGAIQVGGLIDYRIIGN